MNKPDQPPTLLVLNRDLMTGIAIGNAAKSLGFCVERVPSVNRLSERLRADPQKVALAIVDMNLNLDWVEMAQLIRAGGDLPPMLGFGPHVDVDGRRAAKQAGLTRIVSNGEFHRDMAGLIERYARVTPAQSTEGRSGSLD